MHGEAVLFSLYDESDVMQGFCELYIGLDLRYKAIRLTPGHVYRARVKVGIAVLCNSYQSPFCPVRAWLQMYQPVHKQLLGCNRLKTSLVSHLGVRKLHSRHKPLFPPLLTGCSAQPKVRTLRLPHGKYPKMEVHPFLRISCSGLLWRVQTISQSTKARRLSAQSQACKADRLTSSEF